MPYTIYYLLILEYTPYPYLLINKYKETEMEYTTVIDSVGIQIDCYKHEEQVKVVKELLDFIVDTDSLYYQYKDYPVGIHPTITTRVYFIYAKRSIVATITTNTYLSSKPYQTVYYVKVKFAGLKKYNEVSDKASKDFLFEMCDYLIQQKIVMKITELDICIDAKCNFENILVICTKHAPRTNYHKLNNKFYNSTTYIERITKKRVRTATRRSYVYDKSYKEKLKIPITRFELKLQRKFFYKNKFSIKAIENTLDKYHVMYFSDLNMKLEILGTYNSYKGVRKEQVEKLGLDDYRLKPDIDVIEDFINRVQGL